jgi:hypothetical protein
MSSSRPASRQELLEYCLRKNGAPVVEINIDEDQMEDRLDDALQFYQEYHFDATQRMYLKHKITSSVLTLTSGNANVFEDGETLVGQTSGATIDAIFHNSTGNTLYCKNYHFENALSGAFIGGETLVGSRTGNSCILASSNFLTLGDIDLGYLQLDDSITGVIRLVPFTDTKAQNINMFDVRYQLRLNDLFDLYSTSVVYYTQVQQHLTLLNQMLVGEKPIRFNKHMNRLYIDMDWLNYVKPEQYILVECYKIIDPSLFTDVYNDQFLKRYLAALIKRQWGTNMKKFDKVELPGGVILNGGQIYLEADNEIKELEDEMQNKYQLPPAMMLG